MKKGISLIVLVITIIVMIILAASVVITLSNTGVINRASEAVDTTNEAQVQDLAALVWADTFMNGKRGTDLVNEVTTKLSEQGITTDKWNITVTDTGITVTIKEDKLTTLGELVISAADYGKTINYVSDNGVTDWKVFYEDEANGYVYLIASEKLAYDKTPKDIPEMVIKEETITLDDDTTRTLSQVSWSSDLISAATIQNPTMWMANWTDYSTNPNGKCVSYFLDETYWTVFKNTTASYKAYVEGAIGAPTLEMFAESWNKKSETETNTSKSKIRLSNGSTGYIIGGGTGMSIVTNDLLYIWSTSSKSSVWLASPSWGTATTLFCLRNNGSVSSYSYSNTDMGLRPVVCLNGNIPAKTGTTTDYEI